MRTRFYPIRHLCPRKESIWFARRFTWLLKRFQARFKSEPWGTFTDIAYVCGIREVSHGQGFDGYDLVGQHVYTGQVGQRAYNH